MDLLRDVETQDQVFDNAYSAITQAVGVDLGQRIIIRLQAFLGDWFLDITFGVPWFQQILGKGRSKSTVDSIIQSEVYKETDVLNILDYRSTWNTRTRHFDIYFKVQAVDFTVIEFTGIAGNTGTTSFTYTVSNVI